MSDKSTTTAALVRKLLAKIDASTDRAIFTHLYREASIEHAQRIDDARAQGHTAGSLAGLPISVKDSFDIAGDVTVAGSPMLRDNPPAEADSPAIGRLRTAGAIIIGKSNMSELAYSGLGLNPHFGTPLNALDPARIPGGSSAGAAVAVRHGFCAAAIGSDTGGSVRIPAAFNGVVGFKPTQARIPRAGMIGLSASQDTVGPLARTVTCCAQLDAVMSGDPSTDLPIRRLSGLRIAVPARLLTDDLDDLVAYAFEAALRTIAAAGATIVDIPFQELDLVTEVMELGGLVGPEAYQAHHALLMRPGRLDPHIRKQIELYAGHPKEKYVAALAARAKAQAAFSRLMARFDAFACPTVAMVPPRFADLTDEASVARVNWRVLRNTSMFNVLDVPAVTIPCHAPAALPVGFMLVGRHSNDRALLGIAHGIEAAFQGRYRDADAHGAKIDLN